MRIASLVLALTLTVISASAQVQRRPLRFTATATTITGTTAKGTFTRRGGVAADPAILPLGSRIRVSGAGAYSGVYSVTDTGPAIKGRRIDIYMPNRTAAKRFGRKPVMVHVLSRGKKRSE
jgi:peptidoglycan lytic transglycosylase